MPPFLGKEAGDIGLGLMGLTWRDEPFSDEHAFGVLRTAIEKGCVLWNGGEGYGPPDSNSLVLLEKYFARYPEDADKVILSIKGGSNPETHQPDASPENTRRSLDECIRQLRGRKKIDMFEFGRRDPAVPLAEAFGLIDREYVQTGKIGGISLSEVRAETIHEAVRHTQVLAVEVELSLFSTDVLRNGVAAACAQHGIPLVAYSPMGRGMLTGRFKTFDDLPRDSLLLKFGFPRFAERENFERNLRLVERVSALAARKGCTPAQLAVNWTRALSRREGMPVIIPIPGATTEERVVENSAVVEITDDEMAEIDEILAGFETAGERYPPIFQMNT